MDESTEVMSLEYQFVPDRGVSGWLKQELVKAHTYVDGQTNREMVYHRFSFCDSVSGVFEHLYDQPFGLASVSGG